MLMHSQNREMTNLTHTCKDKLGDGLCLYTHTQPKQGNDKHSYRWTEQGDKLHLHTEGRGVTVFGIC